MLTKKFNHILQFNPMKSHDGVDARGRLEKIKFREFKKSSKTMQKIREAGLEKEIDDSIEVEANYKIKKIVGYGATSVVYKAYHVKDTDGAEETQPKKDKEVVAIKKVKNIFESDIYAHRILREIRLLRILRGHKNIVKLKTIMRPSDTKNFKTLNLVSEYCT